MADEIKDEPTPETPEEKVEEQTPEEAPEEETPEGEAETPEEQTPEEETPEEEPGEEEDSSEEDESEYNSYDHPALKQAVTILEESGLAVEEANAIFAEAVETNDLSKIKKDVLAEKIGKDKADVVLVLAESYYNTTFSAMETIQNEVFSLTGGEDNFNAIKDWANEKSKTDKAFAKDLAEIKEMIDTQKMRSVKAAINELVDLYRQDPETTTPANLEVGDKAAGNSSVQPLTRADYVSEINKARREGTYDKVSKQLWARRQAGMKQGI